MEIKCLQKGMVFKKKDKPNTFRIIDHIDGNYVWTRKPNRTPERISYQQLENQYILYTLKNCFKEDQTINGRRSRSQ